MAGAAGRGRFVTLEGGEGAGKSTQLRRLADRLAGQGIAVHLTREPGGSPGAEEIRRLLVTGEPGRWDAVTEALLISAARRDHVRTTIMPHLDRGVWVLSDRFADSTTAYQGSGHGVDRQVLEALLRIAADDLRPDLTIVLDVPVDVGLARAKDRSTATAAASGAEDRFERMDRAFHQRLRDGFLAIAAAEPQRCVVVDAARDADTVAADVWTAVCTRVLP